MKYKILWPYYYSLLPKKMSKLFSFQLSISIKHSKFALIDSVDLKRQIATSNWHQKGDPQVHQEEANGQEAKQATYMNKIVRQNVGVKVRQQR